MQKHTFGSFLRKKRLELGLGLRAFARIIGLQASNYCNIERGTLRPPKGKVVGQMVAALRLENGSEEYGLFFDLLGRSRDEVPEDLAKIIKSNDMIPAMLRTVEHEKVTEAQLRGIIDDLQSGRYAKKSRS